MFNNLFDYSYRRNAKEALGFYITHLILIMLVGGFIGGILGVVKGATEEAYDMTTKISTVFASLICFYLSFLILKSKRLLSNFGYLILMFLSGIVALFSGGLGGLIPAAYLTTRQSTSEADLNSH